MQEFKLKNGGKAVVMRMGGEAVSVVVYDSRSKVTNSCTLSASKLRRMQGYSQVEWVELAEEGFWDFLSKPPIERILASSHFGISLKAQYSSYPFFELTDQGDVKRFFLECG